MFLYDICQLEGIIIAYRTLFCLLWQHSITPSSTLSSSSVAAVAVLYLIRLFADLISQFCANSNHAHGTQAQPTQIKCGKSEQIMNFIEIKFLISFTFDSMAYLMRGILQQIYLYMFASTGFNSELSFFVNGIFCHSIFFPSDFHQFVVKSFPKMGQFSHEFLQMHNLCTSFWYRMKQYKTNHFAYVCYS